MSNDLERYLVQKCTEKGNAIRATLELFPLCNMNCQMCYVRHSKEEAEALGGIKPVSYWKEFIPEMKKMGILFVTLIGGEPFLYPGIEELYEELYKNGFYISLTTNATMLAKGLPKWLSKRVPRYVTVSLYGGSDATYEFVTGDRNGFMKTIQGIENLLQAGIPVKLNYVVLEENRQDLEKIVQLKEKYQLPLLATAYCFPHTRKQVKESECYKRLSPMECAKAEWDILRLSMPEKYHQKLKYFSEENFSQNTTQHTQSISCHAGRSTFWITWQGKMAICGTMKSFTVEAIPGKLNECWEELKNQVKAIRLSEKCAKCEKREICHVCASIMEAETGSVEKCPEYLCKITDEMIRLSKELV